MKGIMPWICLLLLAAAEGADSSKRVLAQTKDVEVGQVRMR